MLVDCPDCSRSYNLNADDIGERGRLLICPRCEARWFHPGKRPIECHGADRDAWLAQETQAANATQTGTDRVGQASAGPDALYGACASTQRRGSFARARRIMPVGVVAVLMFAAVGERGLVVRAMPRTAALYRAVGLRVNVRGLELVQVAAKDEASGDVTIAGEIHNIAGRRVRIPRLAFEIRDRDGVALMAWSQNAPANTLAVGRTISFASAPHRPPPEGRSVIVRFDDGDPLPISTASRSP